MGKLKIFRGKKKKERLKKRRDEIGIWRIVRLMLIWCVLANGMDDIGMRER